VNWLGIRSWRLSAKAVQPCFLGALVFAGLAPPIVFLVTLTAGYILPNSLQGHFVSWFRSSGGPIFSQLSAIGYYVFGVLIAAVTGLIVMIASGFLRRKLLYVVAFSVGLFVNAAFLQLTSGSSYMAFVYSFDFDFIAGLSAMACTWLTHSLWLPDGKLEVTAS